jgi:DNA polymerase III epsilon subunit-like protein
MALIIDIETTGLPDFSTLKFGKYPDYKDIDKYKNCRIVQLCFMLCDENLEKIDIKNKIIKASDFIIPESKYHNITQEISINKGIDFKIICDEFIDYLNKSSHIIAHNLDFDINVLKNELFKINRLDIINIINNKILYCSMKNTINIIKCKSNFKDSYKLPSLKELYKFATNNDLTNHHDAEFDVINLHHALLCLYKNNILKIKLKIKLKNI